MGVRRYLKDFLNGIDTDELIIITTLNDLDLYNTHMYTVKDFNKDHIVYHNEEVRTSLFINRPVLLAGINIDDTPFFILGGGM